MLSIDSKLWQVRCLNTAQLGIIQRASGVMRIFGHSALPDADALASMSEARFDKLCRERFHGETERRG